MTNQRSDVATRRRDQIVEAAVAIIAEQGLQNLSLSEIEKKAGMGRTTWSAPGQAARR
jgi:AcrR family transcriptional regulator